MKDPLACLEPRLQHGNTKLGKYELVWAWNIPPIITCPGASPVCQEVLADGLPRCYALREAFRQKIIKERHLINYLWTEQEDFVHWATAAIKHHSCQVVRWNDTGDWYSEDYIRRVIQIVQATPNTRHYCYTRSWIVSELLPALRELAQQPNFAMWYSFDQSMPDPPQDDAISLCYLAVNDEDQPPCHVDLVFRDLPRFGPPLTVRVQAAHDSLVCPYENGRDYKVTCSQCKYCWNQLEV